MESQKFRVIIVGIIFDPKKRKVLVGKGKHDPGYSFLEIDLKPDEDLDKELKRVTKEKTGYIIHNLGAVYAENNLSDKEIMKIYFLCEATEGKENKGPTVEDMIWVKPSEAEKKLKTKFPTRLREYLIGLE